MGQFHLLFTSEPPAVDAIRHDFIIFDDNVDEATHGVVEGQEYKFKLLKCTIKKKPVYEIIRGRVLRSVKWKLRGCRCSTMDTFAP